MQKELDPGNYRLKAASKNRVVLEQLGIEPDRIDQHLNRIRARKEVAIEEAFFRSMVKTATPQKK